MRLIYKSLFANIYFDGLNTLLKQRGESNMSFHSSFSDFYKNNKPNPWSYNGWVEDPEKLLAEVEAKQDSESSQSGGNNLVFINNPYFVDPTQPSCQHDPFIYEGFGTVTPYKCCRKCGEKL